jgi:hypothetical protein
MAPFQVPCSKEAAEDDAYNMDFVNNTDTLAEGKIPDAVPQETLNGSPSPAATVLPQFHRLHRRIHFGRIPDFHPQSPMPCTQMLTTQYRTRRPPEKSPSQTIRHAL